MRIKVPFQSQHFGKILQCLKYPQSWNLEFFAKKIFYKLNKITKQIFLLFEYLRAKNGPKFKKKTIFGSIFLLGKKNQN